MLEALGDLLKQSGIAILEIRKSTRKTASK